MALIVDDEAQMAETSAARNFFAAVADTLQSREEKPIIALDCEGINLSRVGTIELVSLYFPQSEGQEGATYLIDVHDDGMDSTHRRERIQALKSLLESTKVIKVIHDCRMDSDVLFHLEGIKLVNVHDTGSFHMVSTGREDCNINDILAYHGVIENASRDKSIYRDNPEFWADRPLTPAMIRWASADVDKLIVVAEKQILELEEQGEGKVEAAMEDSRSRTCLVRDMKLERHVPLHIPIRYFIGPRGSNIRYVQKRTGTMLYPDYEANGHSKEWLIFYPNTSALQQVKCRMGHQ